MSNFFDQVAEKLKSPQNNDFFSRVESGLNGTTPTPPPEPSYKAEIDSAHTAGHPPEKITQAIHQSDIQDKPGALSYLDSITKGINKVGIETVKGLANVPFRAIGTPALSATEALTGKKNLSLETPFGKVESFGTQVKRNLESNKQTGNETVGSTMSAYMVPLSSLLGDVWLMGQAGNFINKLPNVSPKASMAQVQKTDSYKIAESSLLKHYRANPELYASRGAKGMPFQEYENVAEEAIQKQLGRTLTQADHEAVTQAASALQATYYPESSLGKMYNLMQEGKTMKEAAKTIVEDSQNAVQTVPVQSLKLPVIKGAEKATSQIDSFVEEAVKNGAIPQSDAIGADQGLVNFIRQNGVKSVPPITVDKATNQIIDGVHRYDAFRELGIKDIPVVYEGEQAATVAKAVPANLNPAGTLHASRLAQKGEVDFIEGGWSKLQKQNPDLFNQGILRKSQNPLGAKGVIPENVHSVQGKWQNYGQYDEIPAKTVYDKVDNYGYYLDKNGNSIADIKTGNLLKDTWDDTGKRIEATISNQQLKDEFIKSFSTKEGKEYLGKVVGALPKNPDGSITAYRVGGIGEGPQSYTLSEGMAKTFSNQGTDILPVGTPGLPKEGYKDFGVLPVNVVKIDPKGIVAWNPYDAEILVGPNYVKTNTLKNVTGKASLGTIAGAGGVIAGASVMPKIKEAFSHGPSNPENDAVNKVKSAVYTAFPFTSQAHQAIDKAQIGFLKKGDNNSVLFNPNNEEGETRPKGARFNNFVVKYILPVSKDASDFILNHTKFLQNLDSAQISIKDTDPTLLAHEMLHQIFEESNMSGSTLSPTKGNDVVGQRFLDTWDAVAKSDTDSPLASIDDHIEKDYDTKSMSGSEIASERFAYLGELVGKYGTSVIPPALRPFYSNTFNFKK